MNVPPGASSKQVSVTVTCVTATSTDNFTIGETGNDLIIYNAVSPGSDGKNDFFRLENIETSNTVTIYNRWGDVMFEVSDYDNVNKVFAGLNKNGKELPSGTCFYKIEFSSGLKTLTGYRSLKR